MFEETLTVLKCVIFLQIKYFVQIHIPTRSFISLYIHRASFYNRLFVPTNALRQFFHCFLYYKDAPIRISAITLPSSGGILSEFLHRPILWLYHNSESVFVTTSYKILYN
jgi:hypothetical protein